RSRTEDVGIVPCADPARTPNPIGSSDPIDLPASSDWSDGLVVSIAPTGRWRLNTEEEYNTNDLLMIQRALIRMCAARGDLFAILTLPEHFHENQALAYIATLKALPFVGTGQAQGTVPTAPVRLATQNLSGEAVLPKNIAEAVLPLGYGERS